MTKNQLNKTLTSDILKEKWFLKKYIQRHGIQRKLLPNTFEDVLQETFTRAFENAHTFDEEKGSVRSWLLGITNNVIRSYLHNQYTKLASLTTFPFEEEEQIGSEKWIPLTTSTFDTEDQMINELAIQEILFQIKKKDKKLFRYILKGYGNKTIAKQLGITKAAFAMRRKRLFERLAISVC